MVKSPASAMASNILICSLGTYTTPGRATSPRIVTLKFKKREVTIGSNNNFLSISNWVILFSNCFWVRPAADMLPRMGNFMVPSWLTRYPPVEDPGVVGEVGVMGRLGVLKRIVASLLRLLTVMLRMSFFC